MNKANSRKGKEVGFGTSMKTIFFPKVDAETQKRFQMETADGSDDRSPALLSEILSSGRCSHPPPPPRVNSLLKILKYKIDAYPYIFRYFDVFTFLLVGLGRTAEKLLPGASFATLTSGERDVTCWPILSYFYYVVNTRTNTIVFFLQDPTYRNIPIYLISANSNTKCC